MSIIKKVLDVLKPTKLDPDISVPENEQSTITNQVLYDELLEHFESKMKALSVRKKILYPTSFNILLHPDDYKCVGQSLPFILPQVIAGFYAAIKTKQSTIQDSDATPPATYWFFQFASSSGKSTNDGTSFIVPGEIVTVSSLYTTDLTKAQQGEQIERGHLTIKKQNSKVGQNNINPDAVLGMEILANDTFTFNFDKKMSESLKDIQSTERNKKNALATLIYTEGEEYERHLYMLDDLIVLSGPKETRKMDNILIINNESVQVGHVQIHYVKETNKFQLCAYAKTRLNQSDVPLSIGGAPIWKDMSYKSDIFLNDEVNVKFKASDSILAKVSSYNSLKS